MGIWESWRQWLRRMPRGLAVAVITIVACGLVIACTGCAALVAISTSIRLPGLASNFESSSATATPVTPEIIGNMPVLGGTISAFTKAYGLPAQDSNSFALYKYTIQGNTIGLVAQLDIANDGLNHVDSVTFATNINGNTDTETKLMNMARSFFPPLVADLGVVITNKLEAHIYESSDLALTFPAARFVDDRGSLLEAGTFYVLCGVIATEGIGGCSIGIGEKGMSGNALSTPIATSIPTRSPTQPPSHSPTPKPGATATPRPTATPVPRPTPRPTPQPTPTPSATPNPEG